MNHIEKFKDIAAALGGEFVPAQWRSDEPALDDRGYIVFGDPTDWRTLRLFIHMPWRGKVYTVSYCANLKYTVNGFTKEVPQYRLSGEESINVGQDRSPEAAAKDIKRRMLDKLAAKQPEKVKAVEAAMAKDDDTSAWKTKMGLDPKRDRGRVWRCQTNYSGPRAELVVGSDCEITIGSLSRKQAEWVVEMLGSMP